MLVNALINIYNYSNQMHFVLSCTSMQSTNRYFIKLAYNGAAYHGWQLQKNAVTVQEVLEEGLSRIFSDKISVTGAGRTDTGVHAREFYAHFDSIKLYNRQDLQNNLYKLNSFLPQDIFISFFLISAVY